MGSLSAEPPQVGFGSGRSRRLAELEPGGSGKLPPPFFHSSCFHETLQIESLADRLREGQTPDEAKING